MKAVAGIAINAELNGLQIRDSYQEIIDVGFDGTVYESLQDVVEFDVADITAPEVIAFGEEGAVTDVEGVVGLLTDMTAVINAQAAHVEKLNGIILGQMAEMFATQNKVNQMINLESKEIS